MISIVDDRGELIATPDHGQILQTVLDELPGADQAIQGHATSQRDLDPMAGTGFSAPFPSRTLVGLLSCRGPQTRRWLSSRSSISGY